MFNHNKIWNSIGVIWVYVSGLFLLDAGVWEYIVKMCGSLIMVAIVKMITETTGDIYKWGKPHLIKFSKVIILKIKKYGKHRKDKQKRA